MTTLTERACYAGEFILSEGNGAISRDAATITGGSYPAGKVLGQVTASGKYTEHTPGASDGSETAAAILYDAVDASAADADGVIVSRLAEVNGDLLAWKSGISDPNKAAGIVALAAKNLIVR